ncbi:MAG TPA: GntR family transcriptional regulator [Nocardioidaceae bacterium]|nr:GntR family transcriptional regulator [Nocardioidaceae bacterium]
MQVSPVVRTAVSDVVFASLVDEILSGRTEPGQAIPSERELAVAFGVNRHAVREALKRVQQAGLVAISQGGKTRVQDWRRYAGLDVLVALTTSGAVPAKTLIHDIAVMRASLGADAARWCARNATDEELAAVVSAAAAFPAGAVAPAELIAIDLTFWEAVIDGSHNVAYRLGLNTLVAGLVEMGYEHVEGLFDEQADRDAHVQLAQLIADRDEQGARALAERLMSPKE